MRILILLIKNKSKKIIQYTNYKLPFEQLDLLNVYKSIIQN